MKFAVRDFKGRPIRFFLASEEKGHVDASISAARTPSHHIVLIDASGSMYGDMEAIRSNLEKLFTLEEFHDPSLSISLLSYSSHGDCKLHFKRVPVVDVMAPGSPHLQAVRNLRTRGLTGISQALAAANALVDDGEVTCVTLHTDGYANDPSPFQEAQNLTKAVAALAKHPQVFCNALAYRNYCDFPLLLSITNALSGVCLQVQDSRQVYSALHDTTKRLMGDLKPALVVPRQDSDVVAFVQHQPRVILGGEEDITVRGMTGGTEYTIFRYREVTKQEYESLKVGQAEGTPLAVFARIQVALGNLTLAKYAMATTKRRDLEAHAFALTSPQIANMVTALENAISSAGVYEVRTDYALPFVNEVPVMTILECLKKHRGHVFVKRVNTGNHGISRVEGTRDEVTGEIVPPDVYLKALPDKGFWKLKDVIVPESGANVSLMMEAKAELRKRADKAAINMVAGIPLDLKQYRNMMVVADGVLATQDLVIRTSSGKCFQDLAMLGLVWGDYKWDQEYTLMLTGRPLTDFDCNVEDPSALVKPLLEAQVLQKFVAGMFKGSSEEYTPEQVAELKAHCLSPALYYTAPTTTPYKDLKVAIEAGEVDSRTVRSVTFGIPEIMSKDRLKSGNEYLQRRFTYTKANGEVVEKPTLDLVLEGDGKWGIKELSARTKLDVVDDLSFPIYKTLLGLGEWADVNWLASSIPGDTWDSGDLYDLSVACGYKDTPSPSGDGRFPAPKPRREVFGDLAGRLDAAVDGVRSQLRGLSFYVGMTGLVPDEIVAGPALTAEQLTAKFPSVVLAKKDKEEGSFYVLKGGAVMTVKSESVYFTTAAGCTSDPSD